MAIATGTAILAGAGLAAGAGLLGSAIAGDSARSAANTQADAANNATAMQMEMFYRNREDLAPWRKAGENALAKLTGMTEAGPGDFTKSPGYDFRVGEGQKALERSQAARGGLFSGRAGKELVRFGQDNATQEYDNFLRRYYESLTPYQALAGVGQSTAAQTAAMGSNAATQAGQNILAAGNAKAAGQMNQGQAWQGGTNMISNVATQGINNYLMWKYLSPAAAN